MNQTIIDCLKYYFPNELVYNILKYEPKLSVSEKDLQLHKKNLLYLNIVKYKLNLNKKELIRTILKNTENRNEMVYNSENMFLYLNVDEYTKISDIDFVLIYF